VASGEGRVREGARAEESDSARGVVQLIATNAPARIVSQTVRQRPCTWGWWVDIGLEVAYSSLYGNLDTGTL
jgi:hypothetical protein